MYNTHIPILSHVEEGMWEARDIKPWFWKKKEKKKLYQLAVNAPLFLTRLTIAKVGKYMTRIGGNFIFQW